MEEKKPLGFLVDSEGDFSSGRLIKIVATIAAIILAISIVVLTVIPAADVEKIKIIKETIIILLTFAGGAEAIQKSLNK